MIRRETNNVGILPGLSRISSHAKECDVGHLEQLPKWLNLLPMILQWLWLSARYGSPALPSAANPAITTGGLVGERKTEYFHIMGRHARAATADYSVIENRGPSTLSHAEAAMNAAGLSYPLILKPDIGWCGFGVRLVRNRAELEGYLSRYPRGEHIVLQRFISDEGEAGLFYTRHPDEPTGEISGVLLRSFPRVVGDGTRSIAELIQADPRMKRLGRDGLSEACCDTARVPGSAEIVRVSIIGSTRVGGLYRDGTTTITAELTATLDAIAKDMKDFHVGRFDVRYESIAALRAGQFTIIEVNGAGSEAGHAWDPALTLRQAYAIVFRKQRRVFAIGAAMRRRGHKAVSAIELARHHVRQQRLIKQYPPSN